MEDAFAHVSFFCLWRWRDRRPSMVLVEVDAAQPPATGVIRGGQLAPHRSGAAASVRLAANKTASSSKAKAFFAQLRGSVDTATVMQQLHRSAKVKQLTQLRPTAAEARQVITHADEKDLESLRWYQQGDEGLYTVNNLQARMNNRHAPEVLDVLQLWWESVMHGSTSTSISKPQYIEVYTKIGLALTEMGDAMDAAESRKDADGAWDEDNKSGADSISRTVWLDSLFEVCVQLSLDPLPISLPLRLGLPSI